MNRRLRRELGMGGAVVTGLGSMLGTGIFVSIGLATGAAGPAVLVAILLAGLLATANALSSAQLAAEHPVSGGTYEYGYEFVHPIAGFAAGWMFLCAKSASAATAAIGLAAYSVQLFGFSARWRTPLACGLAVALTLFVVGGMRRAFQLNLVIVSITVLALLAFVGAGAPSAITGGLGAFRPFLRPILSAHASPWSALLEAVALMFVAFTGYGRIATLGEEVRRPRTTIPRAIAFTVASVGVLYLAVAVVAIGAAGAEGLASATDADAAPLAIIARSFPWNGVAEVVAIGALTALAGVLLNLLLGLSRVVLAMARRGDLPRVLGHIDQSGRTPWPAVLVMGAVVTALAAIGDIRITWSFSAFTVLLYYSLTNLAALALPPGARLYPPWIAWAGLAGCLVVAFQLESAVWSIGLLVLGVGLFCRWGLHRLDPALR